MDINTFYKLIDAAFSPRRWFESYKAGKSYDVDYDGKLVEVDVFTTEAYARPKKNAVLSEFARECIRLNPQICLTYNSDQIEISGNPVKILSTIDQTCTDNPNIVVLVHRLYENEAMYEIGSVCQHVNVKRENCERPMILSNREIVLDDENYIRILLS